jgi:hypothetical protein
LQDDNTWDVPDGAISGTVIAIEMGCNRDGDDFLEAVTIRWANGRIEKSAVEGEDWELTDITPLCYANIYLHDRAYGGCEEGGWFFDTYSPIDGDSDWDAEPPPHGHFESEEYASKAMDIISAWCKDQNSRRRSPSSMASEGHFVVMLESWPAEYSPARRPHYC